MGAWIPACHHWAKLHIYMYEITDALPVHISILPFPAQFLITCLTRLLPACLPAFDPLREAVLRCFSLSSCYLLRHYLNSWLRCCHHHRLSPPYCDPRALRH
jgi:hypothetical protein